MSSPIKKLFGGGGTDASSMLLPLIAVASVASQAQTPLTPATPMQAPTGSGAPKPSMAPSFAGAAAAPTQRQLGGKTLLGQ